MDEAVVRHHPEPWNKGKLVGQKAPFKLKEIWAIRVRLQLFRRVRDLALFDLGIDSKLRACDLVRLKVRDICHGDRVAARAIVMQQKTSRPMQFEITESTREAVAAWIKEAGLRSEDHLFPSRLNESLHLSTRQYAHIVDSWVEEIGLDPANYGTHSMRRTKASLIYRRTKNLRAVQLLLGHTKLEPATPVRRYEREHPGELIHLDIKKLGRFKRIGHRITGDRKGQSNARGAGWEFVHVCIDDASRIALTRIMSDEKAVSAGAFLKAAVAYYKSLGVSVARITTGNGSCYKSLAFARACHRLKIKHIRTKPYTPKTNGKAERFIQTALREWAYARAQTSDQRAAELPICTHHYNLAPPAWQPKIKPAHQPPRPLRGQPVEAPQLKRPTAQCRLWSICEVALRFGRVLFNASPGIGDGTLRVSAKM
jgi:transposase InsO family protein